MRAVRTSESHPLWINEIRAGNGGGLVGITFCPGKRDDASGGFRWERNLSADLEVIAQWRPTAMLTLIEDHEFSMLGVPTLGVEARNRGIPWHHMPITDVRPPDARFEAIWSAHGPAVVDAVRVGGRVLVHCRGGLGRAGTVAARILIELGHSGAQAVGLVRSARPGAIETRDQLSYVMGLQSRGAADPSETGHSSQGGKTDGLV
jgi:ADP-ribosyl-[dinitrogen reductase] hydrolase